MKRAIIILLVTLLTTVGIFAEIPSLTLKNVGFNGTIETVGKEGIPAPVKILDSPSTSSYTLIGAYISTLELSGSGTVILEGCTVKEKTKISGSVEVTFKTSTDHPTSQVGEIELSGSAKLELKDTKLTGDVSGAITYSGTFKMDGGSFQGTRNFIFTASKLTSFEILNNPTGSIGKVDLFGCTVLTKFSLNSTGTISEIDLSGVNVKTSANNSQIPKHLFGFSGTPAKVDTWNVTTLKMADSGLTSSFSIDNSHIVNLDISGNEGLTGSLYINKEIGSGSRLKSLNASGCQVTSAEINMLTGSDCTLNLSGNRLGLNSEILECVYKVEETTSTSTSTGSDLNKSYYRKSNPHPVDVYDEETGEKTGTETRYDRTYYYNFRIGRNLTINGITITTYFNMGTDIVKSQIQNLSNSTILTDEFKNKTRFTVVNKSNNYIAFRFDEQWPAQLRGMNLDLSGNDIGYTVGYKAQDETDCKMGVSIRFWIPKSARDGGLIVGLLNAATKRDVNGQRACYDVDSGTNFWEANDVASDVKRTLYANGKYSQGNSLGNGTPQSDSVWNTEVVRSGSGDDGYSSMRIWLQHVTTWGDSIPRGLEETIYPFGK